MGLIRPCKRCGRNFQPTGKFSRICDWCRGRGLKKHVDRPKTMKVLRGEGKI